MLVDLTPSQVMALCDVLLSHLQQPLHMKVFVDVVRQTETTPEELLKLFVDLGIERRPSWPSDEDRQLLLLALAICALDRPGLDDALRRLAVPLEKAEGPTGLYEEFKRLNADRFAQKPAREG